MSLFIPDYQNPKVKIRRKWIITSEKVIKQRARELNVFDNTWSTNLKITMASMRAYNSRILQYYFKYTPRISFNSSVLMIFKHIFLKFNFRNPINIFCINNHCLSQGDGCANKRFGSIWATGWIAREVPFFHAGRRRLWVKDPEDPGKYRYAGCHGYSIHSVIRQRSNQSERERVPGVRFAA